MSMKFPLKERPFDSVKLSQQRYDELERVAEQVVDITLQEFRDFVDLQNRVMNKTQWKPVKKRDNVVVYKQLTAKHHRAFGPLGVPNADDPLQLPKLVAVGSVNGLMDDMLMGTAVRDAASVLIKTSYVDDLIVDCSVLHQMHGATMDNPFRFVALKWMVKSHPGGLSSVVAPRDFVVVQSSGWIPEEGIGYHMLHSVDIPEYASLENKYSILRSRISVMFIFRQLTPELVEIFVVNYIEPNGSAPESVGVISSAASMCGAWKSLGCAHNMKLAWILKNKDIYLGQTHGSHRTLNTGDKCELCHRRATLTGKLADCSLCESRVCSRCRVVKKLSRVSRRLELTTEKHEVCKTCFVRVVNEDASRIASEMNVGAPITPWGRDLQTAPRKYSIANSHSDHSSSHGSQRETATTMSSSDQWTDRVRDLNSLAYGQNSTIGDHDSDDDVESVILEPMGRESYDNEWQQHYQPQYQPPAAAWSRPEPVLTPSSRPVVQTQPAAGQDYHALYAQMKSLQIAAERTYKLTKDNTRKISHGRTSP